MSNSPTNSADPLWTLSQRKGMNWRTFVVPDAKLMFVQVNKNACTSLKWMIAGIAGEDFESFGPGPEDSTSHFDDIHDRRQWRKVPKLGELHPELRTSIHPDNGWFVFAVTRDPRSRFFSAWQSKLLLNNPGYRRRRSAPWYPRHPASTGSVIEDFAAFVDHLEQHPEDGIRHDGHFRDQVEMLHEDLVAYTEIYDIRELNRLKTDLRAHLDGVGWQGELFLPRANDTPVRANAAVFADGVRERIEKLYSVDFDRFGDRWDYAAIEAVPEWSAAQLTEIDQVAEHGHRIGLLLDKNQVLRSRVDKLARRTRSDRQRIDELSQRLRAAEKPRAWRKHLRSDLRDVVAGVRRRLRAG